ncbi:MAG: hypothetical protein AAGE84_18040 [Cyanobacteria bacterium P01_G01_bin.39]
MTGDNQKYNYVIRIGETIANFFSSLALAVASFLVIASIITLIDADGIVIVQGNEIKLSLAAVSVAGLLAIIFLGLACLILYFLREVNDA